MTTPTEAIQAALRQRDSRMFGYYKSVFEEGFEGGSPKEWDDDFVEAVEKAVEQVREKVVNDFIKKQALIVTRYHCEEHPKAEVVPECGKCQEDYHNGGAYERGKREGAEEALSAERETTIAMFELALDNAQAKAEHNANECWCCSEIMAIKQAATEDYEAMGNQAVAEQQAKEKKVREENENH